MHSGALSGFGSAESFSSSSLSTFISDSLGGRKEETSGFLVEGCLESEGVEF